MKMLQATQQTFLKCCQRLGGSEVLQEPPCSPEISPCYCNLILATEKNLQREGILTVLRYKAPQIRWSGDVNGVRSLPEHWQKIPHQDYSEDC
jgi:hypothetical protein